MPDASSRPAPDPGLRERFDRANAVREAPSLLRQAIAIEFEPVGDRAVRQQARDKVATLLSTLVDKISRIGR